MSDEPPTHHLPLDIAGEYDVEEFIRHTPSTASSGRSRFSFIDMPGGDRELDDLGGNIDSEGDNADQDDDNVSDDGGPGWPFNDDDLSIDDEEDSNDPSSGGSGDSIGSTMAAETWDASQLSANGEGEPRVGGTVLEDDKLAPWVGRQIGSAVLHFGFIKTGTALGGTHTGDWAAVHKEDNVTCA